MQINIKSLIKSGLVAGIVINISAITMVPVVGDQMNEVLQRHLCPPLSIGAMVYFMLLSLVFGFSVVTIYAFTKELFKSKLQAVLIIALSMWFLVYFSSNTSLVMYGFMPWKLSLIGSFWGLMEILLASFIGSWLYKDK